MRRLVCVLALFAVLAASCGSEDPVVVEPGELEIKRSPVIFLPPQLVVIDLDGDGREVVELDGSGSAADPGADIVSYQWSIGLDDIAVTEKHRREFDVGEHVVTLTVTDDRELYDVQSLVVRVLEPYSSTDDSPVIDLWLGPEFEAGDGVGERWVNVLGNVSDPDGVASMIWSLNGGPASSLSLGPDFRRLVGEGDFTIDMLRSTLVTGTNTVELRATDTRGEVTTALVQIDNNDAPPPAPQLEVDWQAQGTLDGLVEVVDGHWRIEGDEVVIDETAQGYDRLLAIGDVSWTDFDVTTSVVVEGINPDRSRFSNTPGFGMLLRWNGHNDAQPSGFQPQAGFRPDGGQNETPYGGFPFYTWDVTGGVFEMQNHSSAVITKDDQFVVDLGVRYHFRSQVQSIAEGAVYRSKLWRDGTAEPAGWNVSYVAGKSEFEPLAGSLVLVAHETQVRWGSVSIAPIDEGDRLSDEEVAVLRAAHL